MGYFPLFYASMVFYDTAKNKNGQKNYYSDKKIYHLTTSKNKIRYSKNQGGILTPP